MVHVAGDPGFITWTNDTDSRLDALEAGSGAAGPPRAVVSSEDSYTGAFGLANPVFTIMEGQGWISLKPGDPTTPVLDSGVYIVRYYVYVTLATGGGTIETGLPNTLPDYSIGTKIVNADAGDQLLNYVDLVVVVDGDTLDFDPYFAGTASVDGYLYCQIVLLRLGDGPNP